MFKLERVVLLSVVFITFIHASCTLSSHLAESVALGAAVAIDHCQTIFKWDKWNCPESIFSRTIEHPASRELAYARAIVSAGIVHTITKNCSHGQLEGCGCNNSRLQFLNISNNQDPAALKYNEGLDYSWGCPDYVDYGVEIAKSFLDDLENGNDTRSLAHLHNNLVGREIVKQTMVKKCICHGMSGSCAIQTCWLQAAPFHIIAAKLKEKYHRAVHIEEENIELENNAISKSIPERITEMQLETLVFLDVSPNYCLENEISGWNGTRGRACSRSKLSTASKSERKSCRNICRSCGYKVKKQKRILKTKCECKFHWCCEVKCKLCTETVEEYYCI